MKIEKAQSLFDWAFKKNVLLV
ncbi:hypothetical protein FBBAL38_04505 [Flavobacteria bacterium BAL38]|nr:hypothetical protein FBBAL38_04505 [Flavobacteria bacterium BAL38]